MEIASMNITPGKKQATSRFAAVIFIIVGLGLSYFGGRGYLKAKASVDWPTAKGKIIMSSVESRRGTGKNKSTTYRAKISYEYKAEGIPYTGKRIAYGDFGSNRSGHARGIVSRYPRGKAVTVYYMPGKPSECLLEAGIQLQTYLLPGVGALCMILGAIGAIFGFKGKQAGTY